MITTPRRTTESKFFHLVSTMNGTLFEQQYCEFANVVIIDQNRNIIEKTEERFFTPTDTSIRTITSHLSGLSISRNMALDSVSDGVALLTDNDVVFIPGYRSVILSAFNNFHEWDIILFQIQDQFGANMRLYPSKARVLSKRDIFRACSIEIAFRVNSVKGKNIRFDERFGLGAKYVAGEETLFLLQARRAGLKIGFYPEAIGVHPRESSGHNYFSPKLLNSKAAFWVEACPYSWPIMISGFSITQYKYYKRCGIQFHTFLLKIWLSAIKYALTGDTNNAL